MASPKSDRGAPIALRGLHVRYPDSDAEAVAGVDLDVGAGELLVLLGASGSGKSTLLRTINRLVEPSAGTVSIDGRDITSLSPHELRRGIGYAIQAVGLFPHLSIARNIAVVPELLGWDRARIQQRVDELLVLVRLDPARYRGRLPRELSGGEQQRVGVARALAVSPPILLMDEPFGAVDAIVRTSLQTELVSIHRALGTTIVFVTHDVDEALRIAGRIAVVRGGRIVQIERPLELLARPADAYVAELVTASDVLRRLGLVRAGDAVAHAPAADGGSAGVSIDADATLREALGRLLTSDSTLTVMREGTPLGTLDLSTIRTALRA